MKQTEWAQIIVIAAISLVFSYIIGTNFLTPSEDRMATVEIVEPISADFPEVDAEVFSDDAINLTELIEIEESKTKNPF